MLPQSFGPLLEQSIHKVDELLLVLLVQVVFANLYLLILVKARSDLVRHLFGPACVCTPIDFLVCSFVEGVSDVGVLFLGDLVSELLSLGPSGL